MPEAEARRVLPEAAHQNGYVLLENSKHDVSAEVCLGEVQSIREYLGKTVQDFVQQTRKYADAYGQPKYQLHHQPIRSGVASSSVVAEWRFEASSLSMVLYASSIGGELSVWRELSTSVRCGGPPD